MNLKKFKDEHALNLLVAGLPNQIWPSITTNYNVGDVVLEAEWHEHPITFAATEIGSLAVLETDTGNQLCIVDRFEYDAHLKVVSLRNAIDMVNNHLIHLGKAYKELDAVCMKEIQPLLDKNKYEQAMLTLHELRISKSKVGRDIYKRIVDEAHANGEIGQLIETNVSQLIED